MAKSKFYVATKGKNPGSLSLAEPGHSTLEAARFQRKCIREVQPGTLTAIYKITWGLKPEHIEGTVLVPTSDLK